MKKILALLLTLTIVLTLFAGCGGSVVNPQESSVETLPASSEEGLADSEEANPEVEAPEENVASMIEELPEQTSSEESFSEEVPEEEIPQFVPVELPIVSEPTEFSIWYTWPPVLTNFIEGPGATPFAEELESRTGIHIDYRIINTETASADFSQSSPNLCVNSFR